MSVAHAPVAAYRSVWSRENNTALARRPANRSRQYEAAQAPNPARCGVAGEHSVSGRHSWNRRSCCRAAAAASASSDAAVASHSPAAVLAAAVKTQLLRCELGRSSEGSASSGSSNGDSSGDSSGSSGRGSESSVLWLEVVKSRQGRVEAACEGELLQLSIGADGRLAAAPAGFLPRLGEPWVKSVPGLGDSLKKIRQQQEKDGALPSQRIAAHGVAALAPRQTLAQFCAEVAAVPGPWCDGTAPGDPPLIDEQQALLTAGELAAFLAGLRGVSLLQLHKGWGDAGALRQPLLRPWVLPLLQQAAAHRGAAMLPSAAPGAPQLGATLVLCSRQQPFHAWGKHLAGQGVQSSIVADSPFYKLLIGRILGYKPANIYHHIESTGGRVSGEVVAAVDAELAALSSAPPTLPWTSGGRRR